MSTPMLNAALEPLYHLTPSEEDWQAANEDASTGNVVRLVVEDPDSGSDVMVYATRTFLAQWRQRRHRRLECWSRIFAVAPHLADPPESILPTRMNSQPVGAWMGTVAPDTTITWRMDTATGEPVLLTLTY